MNDPSVRPQTVISFEKYFGETFRELSESSQEAHRKSSRSSEEALSGLSVRKLSEDSQPGSSQKTLRTLSADSCQETLRNLQEALQEPLRKLSRKLSSKLSGSFPGSFQEALQEALRKLSEGFQETLRRLPGDSQEASLRPPWPSRLENSFGEHFVPIHMGFSVESGASDHFACTGARQHARSIAPVHKSWSAVLRTEPPVLQGLYYQDRQNPYR